MNLRGLEVKTVLLIALTMIFCRTEDQRARHTRYPVYQYNRRQAKSVLSDGVRWQLRSSWS